MKISKTNQIRASELSKFKYDLFIVSSGYETRASFIAKEFSISSDNKVCFKFTTIKSIARSKNDLLFNSLRFTSIQARGDDSKIIKESLDVFFTSIKKKEIRILLDYSSMTRIWYAEIIRYLRDFWSDKFTEIIIDFAYSFSKYSPSPNSNVRNIHVGPIEGFNQLSVPHKPTALIIGLGYEKERAYGLKEYLDSDTYYFYSDTSYHIEFSKEVEKANETLLNSTDQNKIFTYPVLDLKYTAYLLKNLCDDLEENYRIIIAPCGPKPFTLLSLLISSVNRNVDVWRISAGENIKPFDREPDGEIAIWSVSFSSK